MSFSSLQARLDALSDSLKQTLLLVQRLARLQQPSPASSGSTTPLPTESDLSPDELRADLTAEIHGSLKDAEEELEQLRLDVDDFSGVADDRNRDIRRRSSGRAASERGDGARRLQAGCVRVGEDLKIARTRFRDAQLRAKRNAELARHREQDAHISSLAAAAAAAGSISTPSSTSPDSKDTPIDLRAALLGSARHRTRHPQNSSASQSAALLDTTSDLTTSLRRTHDLLGSELSRSRFAHDTLTASNAALEELNTRYSGLDDLLARSRGLLGTLLRSTKSDTWYLETAVWALLATIGWLVFRRLLYGPLWAFLWVPLRLVFRGAAWLLAAVGFTAMKGVDTQTAYLSGGKATPAGTGAWTEGDVGAKATLDAAPGTTPRVVVSVSRDREPEDDGMAEKLAEAGEALLQDTLGVPVTELDEVWATPGPEAGAEAEGGRERAAAQGEQQREGQGHEQIRRGDGEPLRQRDEANEPRNPKKRMWEEPAPQERQGGDGQQQQQQQQQQTRAEL